MGVGGYHTFLERTLDWELREQDRPLRRSNGAIGRPPKDRGELGEVPVPPGRPRFSEIFDLSEMELSENTRARLDSLYEKDGRSQKLSKMIDLSAVGLLQSSQARLDSMYEKNRHPKLSQQFDLSVFGLSGTAQARLDSLYEKSRSWSFTTSSGIEEPRVETTGGNLAFYNPLEIPMDSLAKEPGLSGKLRSVLVVRTGSRPARFDVRIPPTPPAVRDDQPVGTGFVDGGPGPTRLDFFCRACNQDMEFFKQVRSSQAET